MPSVPLGSALRSRDLSAGAKAGVSVGTIVGSILVVLCLWPFVARFIRRRRRRHDASPEPLPVADLSSAEAQPVAQVQHEPAERRMSSDSYGLGPDGRPMHRRSTKDLTLGSFDTHDFTAGPQLTSDAAVSSGPASESPSAPPQIDTNLAQLVASCEERRGYSGSYYDNDIPTEAFGGTPWINKRAPRSRQTGSSRFTASSLLESILRRATTSQKSTSAPSSTQPGEDITALGFSESPTELEFPPNALSRRSSRSSRSSGEGDRALDLGEIEFPSTSPPPAPPAQAFPGTVNPMEVMGATTTKEQTWRTNAELMNLATSPGSHSTGPDHSPDAVINGDPMMGMSQSPEESASQPPTPCPYPIMEYSDGQPNGGGQPPAKPIPDVIVKDEAALSTTHLTTVAPLHSQAPQYAAPQSTTSADIYYTDNSTHSTPFPVPSPSGVSTLNTPDTRISDSSTPSPLPVTPEARQGFSPNSNLSQSPQTPQILVCDKCNQKFDQPHKLNHHKRYHDRPHVCERPGCGKRFGTKTHLDRHVNDKHEQTRRYHCPEQTCAYSRQGGKSFPRKDNLRRHMVNKHNQSPQPDQEFDFVDVVMAGS